MFRHFIAVINSVLQYFRGHKTSKDDTNNNDFEAFIYQTFNPLKLDLILALAHRVPGLKAQKTSNTSSITCTIGDCLVYKETGIEHSVAPFRVKADETPQFDITEEGDSRFDCRRFRFLGRSWVGIAVKRSVRGPQDPSRPILFEIMRRTETGSWEDEEDQQKGQPFNHEGRIRMIQATRDQKLWICAQELSDENSEPSSSDTGSSHSDLGQSHISEVTEEPSKTVSRRTSVFSSAGRASFDDTVKEMVHSRSSILAQVDEEIAVVHLQRPQVWKSLMRNIIRLHDECFQRLEKELLKTGSFIGAQSSKPPPNKSSILHVSGISFTRPRNTIGRQWSGSRGSSTSFNRNRGSVSHTGDWALAMAEIVGDVPEHRRSTLTKPHLNRKSLDVVSRRSSISQQRMSLNSRLSRARGSSILINDL